MLEIGIDANTLYTLQSANNTTGLIISSNALGGTGHHGVICNGNSPYNMLVSNILAVIPINAITYNSTTGDITAGMHWHPTSWPSIDRSTDSPITQIDIIMVDLLGNNIDLTTIGGSQLVIAIRLFF